jgi:hypothetical protein
MTLTEYKTFLLCFLCSYGKLVASHNSKLRMGEWCEGMEERIHTAKRLLKLFKKLDTRELPDFPGTYDNWTKEQFLQLTSELELIFK